MSVYRLKILTPEKTLYDGMVSAVTVTGEDGQLTILAGHAPMVALLAEGPISATTEHKRMEGVAGPGILQVDRQGANLMIRTFRWYEDEGAGNGAADAPPADIDPFLKEPVG